MNSKFRTSRGKYLIKSLFLETSYGDPKNAIYTMKDDDYEYKGKKLISFKKRYLEIADPTEYQQAQELSDSWKHWKSIVNSPERPVKEFIEECREELEVKLRSEGIFKIATDALNGDSRTAITSAKFLADKGWEPKRKAGAPSKEEKEGQLRIQERLDDEIAEMGQRLN